MNSFGSTGQCSPSAFVEWWLLYGMPSGKTEKPRRAKTRRLTSLVKVSLGM